jgi:hypothetical protein
MQKKDLIKSLDDFIKTYGFKKKGSDWYLSTDEIIKIISLQKSSYGNYYYLNYGFQIKELLEKHPDKHISYGLGSLNEIENERIKMLLNLEEDVSIDMRLAELKFWIEKKIIKELRSINTENDLKNYLKNMEDLSNIRLFVRKRYELE